MCATLHYLTTETTRFEHIIFFVYILTIIYLYSYHTQVSSKVEFASSMERSAALANIRDVKRTQNPKGFAANTGECEYCMRVHVLHFNYTYLTLSRAASAILRTVVLWKRS